MRYALLILVFISCNTATSSTNENNVLSGGLDVNVNDVELWTVVEHKRLSDSIRDNPTIDTTNTCIIGHAYRICNDPSIFEHKDPWEKKWHQSRPAAVVLVLDTLNGWVKYTYAGSPGILYRGFQTTDTISEFIRKQTYCTKLNE
jgi:hypothetical protein